MNCAVYARKSNEQNDVADAQKSVTRQIEGARAFIATKGWTLDESHIYTDDGVSGALFANRAEFQRMMRDAEAGAFEAITFFDVDRFGRHAHHTMVALNRLADLGVSVWDFSTGLRVDLDSFEGRISATLRAEFAQQYRDQVRKHTRESHRVKAAQGLVCGGRTFGYGNHRRAKGETVRVINEAEAQIVREIFTRYAAGQGLRTIAGALNRQGAPSPRSQQNRPRGWCHGTVREVLARDLYRGIATWGRTRTAYGRELGKDRGSREAGQVPQPEESWIRREMPDLRIVPLDLAAAVDARRATISARYQTVKTTGRHPQKTHGKYLLTGGMLVCPRCHGHFEALTSPWKGSTAVYTCSTRRRKPGRCDYTLKLSIAETDAKLLDMVQQEVLGDRFISELLALVDRGEADLTEQWTAERDRLTQEIDNLLDLAASGVSRETIAPKIRERQTALSRVETKLPSPRPQQPKIDELRLALQQRTAAWRETLRSEPAMARLLLRKLIGPLTLVDEPLDTPADLSELALADVSWEASLSPAPAALLEGFVPNTSGTSPRGTGVPYECTFRGEWVREKFAA